LEDLTPHTTRLAAQAEAFALVFHFHPRAVNAIYLQKGTVSSSGASIITPHANSKQISRPSARYSVRLYVIVRAIVDMSLEVRATTKEFTTNVDQCILSDHDGQPLSEIQVTTRNPQSVTRLDPAVPQFTFHPSSVDDPIASRLHAYARSCRPGVDLQILGNRWVVSSSTIDRVD